MSLIYNGTTISKLVYNGTEMKKMSYNGTTVYDAVPDPTKSSFTEDEFIALVNAGLQAKMTVGAKVTLTNTYSSVYGSTDHVYSVIGVNHQDKYNDTSSIATNSVDLYADKCVNNMVFGTSATQAQYNISSVRTWLNDTYMNDFTNVKNLLKTMYVQTKHHYISGTDSEDKVKILSLTEFAGYAISGAMTQEGTKYEAFPDHESSRSASDDVYRYSSTNYTWTRSVRTDSYKNLDAIYKTGTIYCGDSSSYTHNFGVAPVIRF